MEYKLKKIEEDRIEYTDEHGTHQTDTVHELIWQQRISRFSHNDIDILHQHAQNDHGQYTLDRCGRLLWVPLDMKPVLSTLITLLVICTLMSVMCTSRTTSFTGLGQTFTLFGDILYFSAAFLFLDMLHELFGEKATRHAVIAVTITLIFTGIALKYTLSIPGLFRGQDETEYLKIFNRFPNAFVIFGFSLMLANLINTHVFTYLRNLSINRSLCCRLFISTCIAQLVFTTVCTTLTYLYRNHAYQSWQQLAKVALSSHLLRVSLAIACLPLVYITIKYIHNWGRKKSVAQQLQHAQSEI